MQAITLVVIRTGFDKMLAGPVNYAVTIIAASLACKGFTSSLVALDACMHATTLLEPMRPASMLQMQGCLVPKAPTV